MLQAAITALILVGIYKLIDGNNAESSDSDIDWWIAFVFVFAPMILIFIISLVVVGNDFSGIIILSAYSLYFIIPFIYLKKVLGYSSKKSLKCSVWIPVTVLAIEIPYTLIFGVHNA
ncbi:hypothetical protein ACJJIW_20745 [Microbulbifer sp. JMSA004]|uniref:hypothetical protein n=1 Tax=unclassified Microbulbifer TaxID=2619833 RepID=UPI0024AE86CE|nr:hypothetical protein [Microbulbifer sp. VAAF005]WHI46441.1 hypothetical protein P0078_22470 [Microbulbifer sp. VAAF005]